MAEQAKFTKAAHTLVVSDIHLSQAQEPIANKPLWKRFSQRDKFVDDCFERFLQQMRSEIGGDIELVLNGDIFDFDSVMAVPKKPDFAVSWLERQRGLASEEAKSAFKMQVILRDHPTLIRAVRDFIIAGNRVVFVLGNHDLELHWPSVRDEIVAALDLPDEHSQSVRFCDWFYVSNSDTYIEHGNQFDAYCLCSNPIHPFIGQGQHKRVRLPFGNLANKLMLNGMGLFNPHVESSYIRSLREYASFFWHHLLRVQPFLIWTWFWGAFATLVVSLREGFLPSVSDPLTLRTRVEDIAARANVRATEVFSLRALSVHPAIFNPVKIARELWLDRALIFLGIALLSFQLFSFLNVFVSVSIWWTVVPFLLFLAPFLFYARGVASDINNFDRATAKRVPLAVRITGVSRVALGHSHQEQHLLCDDFELLNSGTWSPAYEDVQCSIPLGRKCFVWIRPKGDGKGRHATLHQWLDPGHAIVPARSVAQRLPPPG